MAKKLHGLTDEDVAFIVRLKRMVDAGLGRGGLGRLLPGNSATFVTEVPLKVRNVGEEPIPPFSCLKFVGFQSDDGREAIRVTKPDSTLAPLYLCSGRLEIPVGNELGRAYFGVPCYGAYDTGTPEPGQSWGPTSGSWLWTANRPGAVVVGEKDEGRVRIIPRLIDHVRGKPDAQINEDSTGTVSVYVGPSGSETDSGMNVTGVRNLGAAIEANSWVIVVWIDGIPHAIPTATTSEAATIRWKNTDSTTCPPYGIIEIIGAGTDGSGDFYIGRRPSRSSDTSIVRSTRRSKVFYANGPTEVEPFSTDNFGTLEVGSPFRAAYNTSDGTPAAGDTWGPEYDSWLLQKEQSGFVALGGEIDDEEDPADNTALFARPTNDSFFHANFLNGAYDFEADAGVQDIPISKLVNVSHLRDFERDEDGWFVCLNPGRYLIACTLAFVDGTDEPGLHFTPFEPILSGFIYLRAGAGDPPANRTRVQTFVRGAGFYLQTYNAAGTALDRYQNNQPTSVSSSGTAFLEAGDRVGITFEASPETAWTLIVTGSLWAIRLE